MKRIKQRTKRHVAFLLALLLCGQLLAGQALAFSDVGPGMAVSYTHLTLPTNSRV